MHAKQLRPWRALLDLTTSTDDSDVVVHLPTGERRPIDDPVLCDVVTALTGHVIITTATL